MPIEVKVSPPVITISQGRTFMVTDPKGEISPDSDQGVFAVDTRFVSSYRFYINREPWKLINSAQVSFYASRYYLTNPQFNIDGEVIKPNMLNLVIDRTIEEGIHEDFSITNYTGKKINFVLEIAVRSDFADIFEVKSRHFVRRGKMRSRWDEKAFRLETDYTNKDFHRAFIYEVLCDPHVPVDFANGRICFEIELEPGKEWHTCCEMVLVHGQNVKRSLTGHRRKQWQNHDEHPSDYDLMQRRWLEHCSDVLTPNDHVYRIFHEAAEDMGALRIYDLDVSDSAWVPAAGVPWFVTLFGRDSLIVSLQTMIISPGFALGALKRLSEHQATEIDNWRDAQPGKILHELREGELAHFHQIPFTPYYGTADATILYLIVLSEAYRWTGNKEILNEYIEAAENCLKWIDTYGDLDGDGFQEYKTFSSLGYENIGWKDSGDAVVYADGTQVKQPKALCELQGYVYDAKIRMAEIYQALEKPDRARQMLKEAESLKKKFNEKFWMENEGCFAFGLDPDKKQITSVVSNAGHCLWSGIADQEKGEKTVQRLLQEDMWSGWGIRTISMHNPAYNPMAYHLGTIWPHDNGIIAAGFKRYGMHNQANQVIRAVFDAARRFEAYRLPEIFNGLKREGKTTDFPALYPPGANIPQAWASGSIFHMLQTIFGIQADAPNNKLRVHPTLPSWLPDIEVHRLKVGNSALNLRFWLENGKSRWEVIGAVSSPGARTVEVVEE